MHRRVALALPAAALVLAATALPAAAATTIPTTPVPGPVSPGQPPVSVPPNPAPTGHAVGDAASAVGDLQLLPGLLDTSSILPGVSNQLPKQPLLEGGIGLSSTQVNSESYLSYERSIAESSPVGGAIGGNAPKLPGALSQTALPDNPQPVSGGFQAPDNPLLNVGVLKGTVHARYSSSLGPCVAGPISDATTSVADLSALNLNLAQLPDPSKPLADVLNPAKVAALPQAVQQAVNKPADQGGVDPATALGMLAPNTTAAPTNSGMSLLSVPQAISSHSQVSLVDMPGTKNKAVKSTSTFQLADITLLKGMPFQVSVKVASQPTLTVISTGDAKTSTVSYHAPAFEVDLPGQPPVTVDAQHPMQLPVALPIPGIPTDIAQRFQQLFGVGLDKLQGVPVVGAAAKFLTQTSSGFALNLGVLNLAVGRLSQAGQQQTKGTGGAPFSGYQLGATASMFHLDLLPLDILKLKTGPTALASVDFGKQVARAYAPTGGVHCGTTGPAGSPGPQPQGPAKPPLAYTDAAYQVVPLFWTGTGLLLAGAVLVAALPRARRRRVTVRR